MAKDRNMNWDEMESSILDTNSAKIAEEKKANKEFVEEKPLKEKVATVFSKNVLLKVVLPIAAAVIVIVGVFVGGGIISEAQYQQQLREEEARKEKEALRELRDDELVHTLKAPSKKENDLQSGITQLYYSKEDGMMITVTFVSGLAKKTSIDRIALVVKNEAGEVIASAAADIKGVSVEAGETLEHHLYLEPQRVKLKDDPLTTVSYELQVTDTMEK